MTDHSLRTKRNQLVNIAQDLNDGHGESDSEYVRGQAELISLATVTSDEDPSVLKEDLMELISQKSA